MNGVDMNKKGIIDWIEGNENNNIKSWLNNDGIKNLFDDNLVKCINECTSPAGEGDEKLKAIFKAFSLFPMKDTKVLIIGQDPYPEPAKAQGLAFSCGKGKAHSLTKIFKAVNIYRKRLPKNYDLIDWATTNKVLLLNTALTFKKSNKFEYKYKNQLGDEERKALDKDQQEIQKWHIEVWNDFIVTIIEKLITKNKNLVVFLWGDKAKKLFNNCKNSKNIKNKFETCHPKKRHQKTEEDMFLKEASEHFKYCDEEILKEEKIWQKI